MMSSHFKNHDNFYSTEHHQLVDNAFLTEIIRLREMGLLKKEDVCDKELVSCISREEQVFAENRFRFLVEWDPNALTQADINLGYTPLHHAAMRSTLQVFRMVFEYGIRYFPSKKGIILLFKKTTNLRSTPFQIACEKFGYGQVMQVMEDTLTQSYSISDNNAQPLDIVEALLAAAIDENIHLDCVYFLLRRQPDVLVKHRMWCRVRTITITMTT